MELNVNRMPRLLERNQLDQLFVDTVWEQVLDELRKQLDKTEVPQKQKLHELVEPTLATVRELHLEKREPVAQWLELLRQQTVRVLQRPHPKQLP